MENTEGKGMQAAGKFRFSIFYKILTTMLLVAVIPLVAIWYINYQTAKNTLPKTSSSGSAVSPTS